MYLFKVWNARRKVEYELEAQYAWERSGDERLPWHVTIRAAWLAAKWIMVRRLRKAWKRYWFLAGPDQLIFTSYSMLIPGGEVKMEALHELTCTIYFRGREWELPPNNRFVAWIYNLMEDQYHFEIYDDPWGPMGYKPYEPTRPIEMEE